MTQILIPATYLFTDYEEADAEELGQWLVEEVASRLKLNGIDFEVVNDGRNRYSPTIVGQVSIALDRHIHEVIYQVEDEIRESEENHQAKVNWI